MNVFGSKQQTQNLVKKDSSTMKFNSLFLLIISLATVSTLIDIHPASAGQCLRCPVIPRSGVSRIPGRLPEDFIQKLKALNAQKNFAEAERLLVQFIAQAERTQDLNGQAAAHQELGDVYAKMSQPDLAASHLKNADALYQKLGNAQSSSEVRVQLRQLELQQIQIQQIQLRRR
jgi:tetratricopeptide (TPR) repeat protein